MPSRPSVESDPVCGMGFAPEDAFGSEEHDGRTHCFCSKSCLDRFRAAPEKYIGGGTAAGTPAAARADVEYTCPMHPQIVRSEPGVCPICGMALETTRGDGRGSEPRAGEHDAPVLYQRTHAATRQWS